jgi:hypothetical protein
MTVMDRDEWKEAHFDTLIIDFCKRYGFATPDGDYDYFLEGLDTEEYSLWEIFLEKEYIDFAASYYDFVREQEDRRKYGWP